MVNPLKLALRIWCMGGVPHTNQYCATMLCFLLLLCCRPAIMISYLISGAISTLTALCYAE
jgi:amino acid transporter